MCGTKNFASVRLYSAPQLHRTIVAILGICAYDTPKQVETRRHNQTDPLPARESPASGGYLGTQCLQRFQSLDATRNWDYRYPAQRTARPLRREPAGFAMPFRSHPTLKFSAEVFPLLGTSL